MSVKFKDYYSILEIPNSAGADEIKKSYRKLARKYHPDLNKEHWAEGKFKEISEAYEVLSDPEKRKRYDALGQNWKDGQDFQAPPGGDNVNFDYYDQDSSRSYTFNDMGAGFSEFFESLFGKGTNRQEDRFGHFNESRRSYPIHGQNHESDVSISLEEAYSGTQRAISYQAMGVGEDGKVRPVVKQFNVNIPSGITEGSKIRLKGKGDQGLNGGKAGDLYLKIHINNHPLFKVNGYNLEASLKITPWDAALGAVVSVSTLNGKTSIKLKTGTQSGQQIRLKGKGLPYGKDKGNGDLFFTVSIMVPDKLSAEEKKLFEQLAKVSSFKPK